MTKQINVTVKWFNATKGFGFFCRPEGKDIFVHITHLESFGFTPKDMVDRSSALIEFEANGDRKQVTKIHQIGNKLASIAEEPAQTEKPKLVRHNKNRPSKKHSVAEKALWIAGEAPTITLDMFHEVGPVIAECTTSNVTLHAVYNCRGDLAQYVFCERGKPLRSTGRVTEAAARIFLDMFSQRLAAAA